MTKSRDHSGGQPVDDHVLGILPHHLKELRASGLSDQTIREAGIRSESRPDELAVILGWKNYRPRMGAAIVYPYRTADGHNSYCRIKPDCPRKNDKKAVKYEQPKDTPNQVYLPPGVAAVLQDSTVALLITEGEKKALKASQEGYLTLGLAGVFAWRAKSAESLTPDIERIAWKGRTVYIAFDSDAAENENVHDAECRLAAQLANRGATVRVVRIPPGPVGTNGKAAKQGLDDFLVAHGIGEFSKLLDAAEEPDVPDGGSFKIDARNIDAAPVVREFLAAHEQDGVCRLRFWRGTFYVWKRGAYRGIDSAEVRAQVTTYLNERFRKMTTSATNNALEQLKAQAILPYDTEPPAWIGDAPMFEGTPTLWSPSEILVAKNGIVHLPSLVEGRDHFRPATPKLFTTNALDYDFQLDAVEPTAWLSFLDDVWEGDADSIETLQDWFGYCLTQDTRQQKMLLLLGPKRSGKGTIARVLSALVGRDNCSGPTLASLSSNFGLAPLLGKSVAIINDARLSGRSDGAQVVERLLNITGEDAQTIDRKFMDAVTCKLSTRVMIISNELPRLSDTSGALAGRMIILPMTKSFFGKEDHGLTDRLLGELPGILLWAVEGWRRLRERRYFKQPGSASDIADTMADLASPIGAFLRERCHVGSEYSVRVSDLYRAWKDWCEEKGRREPGTEQSFGRDLLAAVSGLKSRNLRDGDRRHRHYEGIGLRAG